MEKKIGSRVKESSMNTCICGKVIEQCEVTCSVECAWRVEVYLTQWQRRFVEEIRRELEQNDPEVGARFTETIGEIES